MPTNLHEQRKPESSLHDAPDAVVASILHGETPSDSVVVYRNDTAVIQRIYNTTQRIEGVGNVELSVDQRHYFEEWPKDFDMVDFRYNQGMEKPIASMQFLYLRDGTFNLSHRFVQPEFRRRGIGERLLAQAEHIFQQGANRESREVEIKLQLGQRGVLQWFLKNGYVGADERNAELIDAVLNHPERFIFETIIDEHDDTEKDDCIFEPETVGRKLEDTVRINLKKVIKPEAATT